MWKRLFKRNRYFIVSYTFLNGSGFNTVTVNNGRYLNKKLYCEEIIKILEDDASVKETGNVIIQNIIELSRRDFENFEK